MELTEDIKQSIEKCVLCWLATSSKENSPNVSPKEIFTHHGNNKIIIANIASPQTVKNIKYNKNVCVSFIDVFVQKGFQIKGSATIISNTNPEFQEIEIKLLRLTKGKFPFSSVTVVSVKQVKPIIAPRYMLYPDTTEEEQVLSAKKAYGV